MSDLTHNTSDAKRIVILGGGFSGAYCALALEKKLRGRGVEVLLLDHHNYMLFYPLLIEAGTGGVEPRHAVVPLRRLLHSTRFRMASVLGLDTERQTVRYDPVGDERTADVHYDHLIVALGSVTKLPPVPGLKEHGFQLKSIADAVGLRDRAIQLLELADGTEDPERRRALLHLVVVGGNYTGVEVAGEFQAFMRQAARYYSNVHPDDCRVTLIELTDRILPALDRGLAEYAAEHLERRGLEVRLKESASSIAPDHVVLKSGGTLRTHTTIWAAGVAPTPLIEKLDLPTDERGYIECERDLRIKGYENLWGIGDGAVNTGPDGQPYPPTAQHAVREGKHLADNLVRVLEGRPAEPCDIKSQGSLAALGCRTGVAKVMGVRLSGFPAWFLWRTVYLAKMPGWPRKLRIAMDWTLNLLFSRDYVQLGLRDRPRSMPAERPLSEVAEAPEQEREQEPSAP